MDVEDLSSVCRGDSHELTGGQASSTHTVMPENAHAIFHASCTIRDGTESHLTHFLLSVQKQQWSVAVVWSMPACRPRHNAS